MANAVATITDDIYSVREAFSAVSSEGAATFEREAKFAIQCITASDYALKIAMANRQSVINAVTNIAAIGISLNPAKKQAYLVPRDGEICLDISYMGLLDIAIDSGSIRWGQAELVRDGDTFELNGFDKPPTHKRNPFAKDRGEVVGVYVVVKTADGDYLTTTMTIDEVNAIRDRASSKNGPWKTDPGEMQKKTVIKRAYKTWPKTDRLDHADRLSTAVHYLNTEGGEGLADINPPAEPKAGLTDLGRGHNPTDGALALLDIETQNYLREVSEDLIALFDTKGVAETYDRVEIEGLDSDQTVALWELLKRRSDIRSALKREGKQRREAAAEKKAA